MAIEKELNGLKDQIIRPEADLSENKSVITDSFLSGVNPEVFGHLAESIEDFVAITDLKGNIQYVNKAVTSRFGYSMDELYGKNIAVLIEPSARAATFMKILAEAVKDSWQGDIEHITRNGELFRVSLKTSRFINNEGKHCFIAISHDITKREKAEQKLMQERELLQNLMNSMPDTIYFKDTEGKFTRINMAQAEILGLEKPEDAIGKSDFDFFDPIHSAEAYKDEQNIITTGKPIVSKPEYIRTADGSYKWVSASKAPYIDSQGKITGIMGISRDITAEREAHKKLAENEALLRGVIDGMSDMVIIRDTSLQPIKINKPAEEFMGSEIFNDVLSGETGIEKSGILSNVSAKKALETGKSQVNEVYEARLGKFFECRITPLMGTDRKTTLIIEQIRDITDKIKNEKELAVSQQRLMALIDNLPAGVVLIREDSIYINIAAGQIMNIEPEKVTGPDEWFSLIFKNNALNIRNMIKNKRKQNPLDDCAISCFRADGTPFIADVRFFRGLDDEVWLISDITEKMRAEKDMSELYHRFAQITSQLPGMVYQFVQHPDKSFSVQYSNDYINDIFGKTFSEVEQNPESFFDNVLKEDFEGLMASIEESASTLQQWNHEFRIQHKDKGLIWVKGSSSPQRTENGSTIWYGFITNITKDKQVESDIKEANERLEATMNAMPDLMFEVDDSGIIYSYHAPLGDNLYVSPELFTGKSVNDILPAAASSQIMKAIAEAAEAGLSTGIQYQLSNRQPSQWFELSISKKDTREPNHRFIALVRNITSRKESELQLAHQSKVLEGVAKATTALLAGEDIDEAINYAFKIIGTAARADRVYLFEYNTKRDKPEELLISQRFEWCGPDTVAQIGNPELQDIPADTLARWNKLLASGLPVRGLVKDFPENEQAILEPQHIISLLVVPVFTGDKLFGFVGFDDCSGGYNWSQSESLILQSLASGIGNAILRKRSDENLRFSENRFRVMFEESPIGLMLSDETGKILDSNRALIHLLSGSDELNKLNSFFELIPERYTSLKEAIVVELKRTGRAGPVELNLLTTAGNEVPVLMNLVLVRDLDLKPLIWSVLEDTSERKRTETELIKTRDEANRANRAKSEFLANMSHEIRTPLNAILGFSELLADQLNESKHREFVEVINKSGKNLLLIINDILDLSKIEAGKVKIELEPVNPRSILSELNHIFSLATSEKKLKFVIETDPNLPQSLLLDETRVRQVLFNLVGNAVKFTQEGQVTLSVKVVSKVPDHSIIDLMFEVSDTGIGIPADQHDAVFQAFRQQEGQSTRKFGGTGLGLTITKRFIEMMNGQITVMSEPGKGSSFRVWLFDVNVAAINPVKSLSAGLEIARLVKFDNPLILLVEDIDVNRLVIREMLKHKNIRLIEAENGKVGLEMVQNQRPDLILMDMQMPVMDGYTLTSILKNDENLKSIPIVALTASAMKDESREIRLLCDGYLQKPVTPDMLTAELSRFLSNNAAKTNTGDNALPVNHDPAANQEKLIIDEHKAMVFRKELGEIREGMVIDEIIGFAARLGTCAVKCRSVRLQLLADEIKIQAESFHIDKLEISFQALDELLENIIKP